MDPIFKRLGNLFRSYLQDDDDTDDSDYDFSEKTSSYDADYKSAWDELNNFMNEEKEEAGNNQSRSTNTGSYSQGNTGSSVPGELSVDFKNLEVPFGASMDEVKKAYKKFLIKYHPDRHASNPEKLKEATEITQRISHSFLRIKNFYKKGKI